MRLRTGSIGIEYVIIAALAVVALLVMTTMLTGTAGDLFGDTDERVDDASCDTWAERSTTAGNTSAADRWEEMYNENCEGELDQLSDSAWTDSN